MHARQKSSRMLTEPTSVKMELSSGMLACLWAEAMALDRRRRLPRYLGHRGQAAADDGRALGWNHRSANVLKAVPMQHQI
jgi:hypothetical protein